MIATPSSNTTCAKTVNQGRFSTIRASVVNPPLDEAELHDSQCNHDQHHDGGLSRGTTKILAAESILVDFVNQDLRRLAGTALGQRFDDAKGADQHVQDVDHQQEEAGWRE